MFKYLPILAALAVLLTGSAYAQQQEGVLQKVEVPHAGFDLVITVVRPSSSFSAQSDAREVYLADGELVHSYTGRLQELDSGILMPAACTFQVERRDYSPRTPVTIHVIPKGISPLAATR
jgi:hypothetical protein